MEPPGVLFVTAGGERGGAEAVLLTLLRHLDRTHFRPHVCCLATGPFEAELARLPGLEVTAAPVRGLRHVRSGWRAVARLRALVRERAIALVHSNGTGAHLYGGVAARLERVPAVFHAHDLLEGGWSGQGLVNGFARRLPAAAVVTPSRFLARTLAGRVRAPVHVIVNGVDAPDGTVVAAPAPAGGKTVVWCGRLQHWKGAHVFLDAAARVHRARPGTRFVVVGGALFGLETGYAQALGARAAALGLSDAVRFAGHLDDPLPELAAANLVVHSAIRPEPFGLVIVEAMLAGKAVVAPAEGGPAEIVEPGTTGLLVPPRDSDALADAVVSLLDDDGRRAAMGRAGRARARERFGADAMARGFERLYADLLGPDGTRAGDREDA